MSSPIVPIARVDPLEPLADLSRPILDPPAAPRNLPSTDPTLTDRLAAQRAAAHPATEPLVTLGQEAHTSAVEAKRLVAIYAAEQAAEDAAATHTLDDQARADASAEAQRLIVATANDDAAAQALLTEQANDAAATQTRLTEHANDDAAAQRLITEGANKARDQRLDVKV